MSTTVTVRRSPSGENRVVDQETQALIAGRSRSRALRARERRHRGLLVTSRRLLIPAQVVWSPGAARDIGDGSRILQTRRRTRPQSISDDQPVGAARLPTTPGAGCGDLHNYRLICPSGDLFRDGRYVTTVWDGCSSSCDPTRVLPGLVDGDGSYRRRCIWHQGNTWQTLPSAYIFISSSQRELFSTPRPASERCFVKHNLVYPMDGRGANEPLVVYHRQAERGEGPSPSDGGMGPLQAEEPSSSSLAAGHSKTRSAGGRARGPQSRPRASCLVTHASRCSPGPGRGRAFAWHETFGLVIAEAMSASVPSIAPAHGSFPEFITDGVDGVLFAPGDVDTLVRLWRGRARPRAVGGARRTGTSVRMRRRFEPDKNIAELEEIYRFAIEHPVWIEFDAPGALDAEGTVSSTHSNVGGKMSSARPSDSTRRGTPCDRARRPSDRDLHRVKPGRPATRASSTPTEWPKPISPDSGNPIPVETR